MLDDFSPAAKALIDEVSYHRYDSPDDATVRSVRMQAEALGAETSMLEFIKANQHHLYSDLVNGHVSAWQQFALAWYPPTDDGASYYIIDRSTPGSPVVTLSSRARMLSQYFRYIRAGAQRVEASTSMNGVSPTAFVHADGKMVVVANVNAAMSFSVGGLAAGTYEVTYTTPRCCMPVAGPSPSPRARRSTYRCLLVGS